MPKDRKTIALENCVAQLEDVVNVLWAKAANDLGQDYPSLDDVRKALVPSALCDLLDDCAAMVKTARAALEA